MKQNDIETRLSEELKSFENVWKGGYFEGEVLDSVGNSSYGPLGFVSVLYALYLIAIKPFVNNKSIVLEIGPGRGAFTKSILKHEPKEIWCLDAISAEENQFFQYVGHHKSIRYHQVEDFSLSMLPDARVDFVFSFGALCHVSFDGIEKYLTNLFPKLKSGAQCFIMVADYNKYNTCMENVEKFSIYRSLAFHKIISLNWLIYKIKFKKVLGIRRVYPEDQEPSPGRWYHAGIAKTRDLLVSLGYDVISEDIGIIQRDPVIHFQKL